MRSRRRISAADSPSRSSPPVARYTLRRQPDPGAARLPCSSDSVVRLSDVSRSCSGSGTGGGGGKLLLVRAIAVQRNHIGSGASSGAPRGGTSTGPPGRLVRVVSGSIGGSGPGRPKPASPA